MMLTSWELAKALRVQDNIPDNCACGFRVFNKLENIKIPLHPIEDYQDREILLNYKLDEIAPQYQQLENLLSRVAQPNRKFILGYVLNNALNSENPVAFINNQLDEFRRAKTRNRMLDEISASLGFNKNITKEYLRMRLK